MNKPSPQKLALTWAFGGDLENEQTQLIAALKPFVTQWNSRHLPKLARRLERDSLANNSTFTTIRQYRVRERAEPVWLFLAICVNRTLPSDCVVAVGTSEKFAMAIGQAFHQAQEEKARAFAQAVTKGYTDGTQLVVRAISEAEFHDLYEGPAGIISEEVAWFADPLGRILGTVVRDLEDNDWGYIVLGRDERGTFRCIYPAASIADQETAAEQLRDKMQEYLRAGAAVFPQGDDGPWWEGKDA